MPGCLLRSLGIIFLSLTCSFDQHALIDLPAMISYVLNVTGQEQVYYVGHSQGTIMGFAGASYSKILASKIKAFYALAPITTIGHIEGALKYIAEYSKEIKVKIMFLSKQYGLVSLAISACSCKIEGINY